MKKLLSLPANAAKNFHDFTDYPRAEYYATSDPADRKLGSGGGTTWLLNCAHHAEDATINFEESFTTACISSDNFSILLI